jgi:hypothetical protein
MKRPRTLPTVEKFIENLVISIGRKVEKLITEAEGRMDEMTPEQRKRVAEACHKFASEAEAWCERIDGGKP